MVPTHVAAFRHVASHFRQRLHAQLTRNFENLLKHEITSHHGVVVGTLLRNYHNQVTTYIDKFMAVDSRGAFHDLLEAIAKFGKLFTGHDFSSMETDDRQGHPKKNFGPFVKQAVPYSENGLRNQITLFINLFMIYTGQHLSSSYRPRWAELRKISR